MHHPSMAPLALPSYIVIARQSQWGLGFNLQLTPKPYMFSRWVPLLFGQAAIILGLSHPFLDDFQARRSATTTLPTAATLGSGHPLESRPRRSAPAWPAVVAAISVFVLQYAASGVLEEPLLGSTALGLPALDMLLAAVAALQWLVFERTPQGKQRGLQLSDQAVSPERPPGLVHCWRLLRRSSG